MAHILNINWHAFIKKNEENAEVVKYARKCFNDYFLSSNLWHKNFKTEIDGR